MLLRRGVCRPSQREAQDAEMLRELAREAVEVLKHCPAPDTFLGRKTQEPFPKETREQRRPQLNLRALS